jgi:hypothetical protein
MYYVSWVLVAHTCNPSYSGGRDQEDRGWKPAQIVLETLTRKYPSQKELVEWLKVKALNSSPSTEKEKENVLYQLNLLEKV